jgi:3-oxoacyl-[acyl-carrier-protein] synthase II
MSSQLIDANSPENTETRSDLLDIVVTGIGLATPLGLGCSVNLDRLLAGESGVKNEILPGVDECHSIASGRCPDFDLSSRLRFPKSLKYMSRPVQLAMHAALEAFETSRLQRDQIDPFRLAIYTASGQTGLDYKEFSRALEVAWGHDREPDFRHVGGMPTKLIDPYFSLRTLANGGMGLLSAEFGAKGPSNNFVHSDNAPALALQAAYWDLAEGRCDAAIVGGFDSLIYPTALFALSEAGEPTGDAPHFGQSVPAEGAAFFILERRGDALDRGADILGEIMAIECSQEPLVRNSEESMGRSMRKLLQRLPERCRASQFAVSPGSAPRGSVANAIGQSQIVSSEGPLVSSMMWATGYLGAATAAVELALGLLSVRRGFVPSVMVIEESNDGSSVTFDETAAVIDTPDPTGIFFSRSWSGQIAMIVARAYSAAGKAFGACAP